MSSFLQARESLMAEYNVVHKRNGKSLFISILMGTIYNRRYLHYNLIRLSSSSLQHAKVFFFTTICSIHIIILHLLIVVIFCDHIRHVCSCPSQQHGGEILHRDLVLCAPVEHLPGKFLDVCVRAWIINDVLQEL